MKKTNKEVKKETEANLISFKVLLNRKNQIVTELSQLPEKHIENLFHSDEAWVVRNVIKRSKEKLSTLHDYLQRELRSTQDKQ
jgi:hypothetical protein|tara:strand:- start:770 stop:1018 length:249 start_codon:yes stop_codon:yes gene_type:complete